MRSKKSITVWCIWCALLSGLLWMIFHNAESSAAEPGVKKDPTGRYEFREDHDPDGQGKFYMGRELAQVMGFQAAWWLDRENREQEERLSILIEALKIKPGHAVCDLGAGSGVLTLMMAQRVGETGKVYAVDIQQEMLDLLADKTNRLGLKQVELVLGTEKNPKLEPASLDLLLMVDVYHEFAYPYEMMVEICKAMKPSGRVVFVEYRKEDPEVPIKLVHKMSEAQVKKEMSPPEFGMKWKETIKKLPRQHVIVFERLAKESSK